MSRNDLSCGVDCFLSCCDRAKLEAVETTRRIKFGVFPRIFLFSCSSILPGRCMRHMVGEDVDAIHYSKYMI